MKNAVLSILLLSFIVMLSAVPRNLVVVEVATGTWCGYCPGAAMGCHDLIENGHAVAVIKNHNGDSYANTYSNARNSYYNPSGFPSAYFDGLNVTAGGSGTSSMYSNYLPKVNARLAIPSKYTLSAIGNAAGSLYTVGVTIAKPEADDNANVRLHAVLTESSIPQNWFNQTTVDNVNRLMVPDQNGTNINLGTGEQTTITLQFNMNPAWEISNCEMVFFLQNHTSKEILQGVKYSLAELVGAFPISHETLEFPNQYIGGSATIPVSIANFSDNVATGTIAIDNPAFTSTISDFSIAAYQSINLQVSFTPSTTDYYTGTMTITSNLYNHPNIEIPLSGIGFTNAPPVATDVMATGTPIIYQEMVGSYTFSDPDGDGEGATILQWYRIVNDTPEAIDGANEATYQPLEADIGYPLAFEVTPVDQHGMPGDPVMSAYSPAITNIPAPRNLSATVTPPSDVTLTWEPPENVDIRAFVGYRLFRNGLNISTITNPTILTFTDTYVPDGVHEYWVCTLFNNPMLVSDPSNIVTVRIGVANDDVVASPASVSVYPNPFGNTANFEVQAKAATPVKLSIYNLKGQLVKSWNAHSDAQGISNIQWNGTDNANNPVHSGIYYYKLEAAGINQTGRIVKIH